MFNTAKDASDRRATALWLMAVAGLVALMVLVGGITRLTDSGLSITSWKPIHGALPPMSEAEWAEEFDAYKAIPEYQRINRGMSLDDFKGIFWWEWIHRNLGRLIGLAFAVPFLVLLLRGQLRRAWIPTLAALFLLGAAQGALGWFMVMSGLKDRVDVSQYRLTAHLVLAFLIYAALLWTAWRIWPGGQREGVMGAGLGYASLSFLMLVLFQITLGGFVAGTDAGLTYNTWPLMDGALFPPGLYGATPWWSSPFEDVTTIQFNHRVAGYLVAGGALGLWLAVRRARGLSDAGLLADIVLAATVGQVALGIAALLAAVPLWLGGAHQAGALMLLTAALALHFRLAPGRPL